MSDLSISSMPDNFYDKIKPRLYQRVGRELRLAHCVLDLGCGACELAQYLSETYGQRVTGVDISADSFPKQHKADKNTQLVRCICKDAARLDRIRNRTMDAVILFWALHEMKNPQAVLQEAHRVSRPGGKVLVVEFPRNSLAQKIWNENYYTSKELTNLLHNAGYQNIQAKRIENKQILWVNGHRGAN